MEWISIKDKLPPNHLWVVVKPIEKDACRSFYKEAWGRFYTARYTGDEWEFFNYKNKFISCPGYGDSYSSMDTKEISHWLDVNEV